jgi:hypothetical protein
MSSSPKWVYLQAFGVLPSKDISIEKSEYEFSESSEEIILKFKTNNLNKVLELLPELRPITQKNFEKYLYRQLPYWFKPLEKLPSKFYSTSPDGERVVTPEVILSFDSESGTVYFRYFVFD